MRKIIFECKELGTHFFMFTGGEPLIRKKDLITLALENQDCIFLAFTNGTLVDEEFCLDLKKCKNFGLALSIEERRKQMMSAEAMVFITKRLMLWLFLKSMVVFSAPPFAIQARIMRLLQVMNFMIK